MNNSFARRAPTNVALAILAVFGLVMASFAVARPTLAQHGNEDGPAVTPTVVAGNPVCPGGTVEVKFENDRGEVVSGSEKDFTIGGSDANIEITWTDGYAFNYDTDGAEAAHVFVKGGDAANHYDYTAFSGGGVQHDDGLIAPLNTGNQQAAISHITFCFVATSEPTSTPTATPTATPTPTPNDDAGILIEKEDEDGAPLAGAVFTVEGAEGEFTTGADGRVCVDGLPEDTTLTVTEIQAPAGYEIASPASRQVETDDDGCDRSPEVTFVNMLAEATPTPTPTEEPTASPTEEPSATPTPTPTEAPTATPTPTDEEPSVATPTPTPREDTAGGTPAPTGGTLPDTATAPMTGQVPAAALALLALFSMGVLLYARLAEARRRS